MTGKQIFELLTSKGAEPKKITKFLEWAVSNRHVYQAFEQEALKVVENGFNRFSAKEIWERLRRNTAISTTSTEFKLSNNYTAYFAHIFNEKHPDKRIFETKKLS